MLDQFVALAKHIVLVDKDVGLACLRETRDVKEILAQGVVHDITGDYSGNELGMEEIISENGVAVRRVSKKVEYDRPRAQQLGYLFVRHDLSN
jgi:putative hemolysin